ncbi:MAG: XRE family transcriptional regulator [Rivularia sp. (in: Bacteria)]|nr:XRE family transcriptional regulator [Rivularia sp. MS3]
MKTTPFSELRQRMTVEQRAKSDILAKLMLLHINLLERKESLGLTQDNLQEKLNIVEFILSELENQEEIQVSTLSRYINALGGSLKIVADFPNEEIVIAQFE